MEPTARLRAWTYRRLRLGDPAASPEEALRAVVAVYSAHPTAPLALAARIRGMRAEDFRDMERRRAALRIPGMRGTMFLAPRETAGRLFAPFDVNRASLARRLNRGGLTEPAFSAIAARVVAAASVPLLPRELRDAAGVEGVEMSLVLRVLRNEGVMLAVPDRSLRAANLRYVRVDEWAPGSLDVADVSQALIGVAGDYLRAYGPVRPADFGWWTGLPARTAAAALAVHDTVDVGAGLLLAREDEAAYSDARPPRNRVDLLPKWDPYTMGFAPDGRARLVHPDNQRLIYVQKGVVAPGQPNIGLPGDGYPVVLVDGEAVGTWNLTLKGGTVDMFDRAGIATRQRLDARLAAVEALLAG